MYYVFYHPHLILNPSFISMDSNISQAKRKRAVIDEKSTNLPFFAHSVSAEFSMGAKDTAERTLDLHRHLVQRPASTFFLRAEGDGMISARIQSGDILIVDKSIEPKPGRIVVACVDGEFLVRRLEKENGRTVLRSAGGTSSGTDTEVVCIPGEDFFVWGVVMHVVHRMS
jgi:DNA polymerase V